MTIDSTTNPVKLLYLTRVEIIEDNVRSSNNMSL